MGRQVRAGRGWNRNPFPIEKEMTQEQDTMELQCSGALMSTALQWQGGGEGLKATKQDLEEAESVRICLLLPKEPRLYSQRQLPASKPSLPLLGPGL